jgi:hypothetical protein
MYSLVGLLALQAALLGDRPQSLDKEGALETIESKPFGHVVIVALACGFGAYAAWRLVMAAVGSAGESRRKAWAKRIGHLARGLFYAGVCVATVSFLLGHGESAPDDQETGATRTILRLPLGRWLVGLAGAGFVAAGAYAASRAIRRTYEEKLDLGGAGAGTRRFVRVVASVGLGARAAVFALFGWFLGRAALRFDPEEAVGLDGALMRVARAPHGDWILGGLAAGLFAYGLYVFVEARYRRPSAG